MTPLRMAQALLLTLLGGVLVALNTARAANANEQQTASKGQTLVIFGASYAKHWGNPQLPGYQRIINRGVGGQETSDMLQRFQRDVIAVRPDAVLIWGHANNITRARPNELRASKAAIEPHYERMVEAAQRAGIDVILATDVPWTDPDGWLDKLRAWIGDLRGKQSYAARTSAHIREVNYQLRALAAREGCTLLDFERVFANAKGTRKPQYAREDLSHISPAGYRALSAYAKRELSRPQHRSARVL
jgi:lysophospholipase L1-like esterase